MPELPDVLLYLSALETRVVRRPMTRIRLGNPFLLRSVTPSLQEAEGRSVVALHRLGKRIVFELENELFLVIHLMIAGRFKWRATGVAIPARLGLAAFDFPNGTLLLTEAGSKKRASLYVVQGRGALVAYDPGGLDVLSASANAFADQLARESHTLKRALTDPGLFSGIGNAYSDEILHAARLSPLKLTTQLSPAEMHRLHNAARQTLREWIGRLQREAAGAFPEKVTAFHPGMAVHGRYRKPCPICGTSIQRIVYASNEANYCPRCQTGGKLLADRSLSRLLKSDWPRRIEDLERVKV